MKKEVLYKGNNIYFTTQNVTGMSEANYIRLTADEGKAITDGENVTQVADVSKENANNWADCEKPNDEIATEADYIATLAEFGVKL